MGVLSTVGLHGFSLQESATICAIRLAMVLGMFGFASTITYMARAAQFIALVITGYNLPLDHFLSWLPQLRLGIERLRSPKCCEVLGKCVLGVGTGDSLRYAAETVSFVSPVNVADMALVGSSEVYRGLLEGSVMVPIMNVPTLVRLAAHQAAWREDGLRFLPIDVDVLAMLENKASFTAWMARHCPRRSPVVYDGPDSVVYPCYFKTSSGGGGEEVRVLNTAADLEALGSFEWFTGLSGGILQEAIHSAEEFQLAAVCCRGRIVAHQHYRVFSAGGSSLFVWGDGENDCVLDVKSPLPPSLLRACEDVIRTLEFTGFINFDMKMKGDEAKLLECNPRLAGTWAKVGRLDEAVTATFEAVNLYYAEEE